jgi:hypothetical protein
MVRRGLLIAFALLMTTLTGAAAAPWLLYWIGLGQIEGRPSHALQSIVTTRDMQELGKRLKYPSRSASTRARPTFIFSKAVT